MRKKLQLDLDDLKVESFETTPIRRKKEAGTVRAYATDQDTCNPMDCRESIILSCIGSCFNTCVCPPTSPIECL